MYDSDKVHCNVRNKFPIHVQSDVSITTYLSFEVGLRTENQAISKLYKTGANGFIQSFPIVTVKHYITLTRVCQRIFP